MDDGRSIGVIDNKERQKALAAALAQLANGGKVGFDEASLSALRKWRFAPATKDGQPIAVQTTIEVGFALPTRAKALKRDYNYQTYNAAITATDLESLQALSSANLAASLSRNSSKKYPRRT